MLVADERHAVEHATRRKVGREGRTDVIFFDIDGTLLDFKAAECHGVRAVYARYGMRLPQNEAEFYAAWVQIGHQHFTRYLAGQVSFAQQQRERVKALFTLGAVPIADADAAEVFRVYLVGFEAYWKAFDDVTPCLGQLRKRHRLGIISNGDLSQQRAKLKAMGILNFFDVIVTSSEVGVSKPDPEIFLAACRRAEVLPSVCIYVGDTWHTDIRPSLELGMRAIWLHREEPEQALDPEVLTIRSLHQLIEWI